MLSPSKNNHIGSEAPWGETKKCKNGHIMTGIGFDECPECESPWDENWNITNGWREKFYKRFPVDKIAEGKKTWGDYKFKQLYPAILNEIEFIFLSHQEELRKEIQKLIDAYHWDSYRVGTYKEVLNIISNKTNE